MLRRLEWLLWVVAAGAIAVYAGTVGEQSLSQAYLNWEFAQTLALPMRAIPPNDAIPNSAQPLGRLEIPSIGLSAIFIEGVDDRALRRAVGHIPGTALPGTIG